MDKVIERRGMISGMAEAEARKYIPIITEDGCLWLVADQPNMADHVYYCAFDPKSQGFGGSTLTFQLVDGDSIDLQGPWHGNADSLFEDTGIDIRDTRLTYVVIARERTHDEHWRSVLKDILYEDKEPTMGIFHRGEVIAKEIANGIGHPVILYSESQGGSSEGPVRPDGEAHE